MSAPTEDLLDRASRCVLGCRGTEGPAAVPTAFWSDGMGLWMTVPSASVHAAGLDRDPSCVAYVPPVEEGQAGVLVRGRARVYRLSDPRALLHTPMISAAMAALAVRTAGTLVDQVQGAARIPPRLPRARSVLRLAVEERRSVDPPDVGPGVAPALPTDVPADVRRALAGQRRVVLVYADSARGHVLQAAPAVWGAGYALATPPSLTPPAGALVVAAVEAAVGHRGARPAGLAVHGVITSAGRLDPRRATSWSGADTRTVAVSPPTPGGVRLPD